MRPDKYPGMWLDILQNITAFRTTYYGEAWFMFPYALLALSHKWVFALLDRYGIKRVLFVVFVLNYAAMSLISRYYASSFDTHYALYHVVVYFDCLLLILLGAVFCKCSNFQGIEKLTAFFHLPRPVLVLILATLFLVNCFVHSAAFGPFYLVAFVLLFVNINWHPWFLACCRFLGRFSTSVWLIHTWFCYYLFHDFIYGLHYPILILVVEFAVSIMVGYVIQKVAKQVYRVLGLQKS